MKIKSNKVVKSYINSKINISNSTNKKNKSRNKNNCNFFPNRSVRNMKIRTMLIEPKEILDSPSNLQDTIKTLGDSSTLKFSKQSQLNNHITDINKLKGYYCPITSRKFNFYNIFDIENNYDTFDNNNINDRIMDLNENINFYYKTLDNNIFIENKYRTCKFHLNEKIYYFCINCKWLFCNKCLSSNQYMIRHKSHIIVNYSRYNQLKIPKLEKELKNKYINIEWYISRCNKYIENYEIEKKLFLEQIEGLKRNYINKINNYITKIKKMIELMNDYKNTIFEKQKEIETFLNTKLFRDKINQLEDYKQLKDKFIFNKNEPFSQKDINNIITSFKFRIAFKSFHTDLIKLSKKTIESNAETIYEIKLNLNNSIEENDDSSFKVQHRSDWNPESVLIYFSLTKNKDKYYRNSKGFFLFRKYSGDTQIYSLNRKENNFYIFLYREIPWKRFFTGDDFIFIKAMFFEYYFI